MPPRLATYHLPPGWTWPASEAAFGAAALPVVAPSPDEVGSLAASLAAANLADLPISAIVAAIGRVARRWRDPALPERQLLRDLLPSIGGYSPPMVDHIVERMAADWDEAALWARLRAEFGDPALLDGWRPRDGAPPGHLTRAWGPRLTFHVCAGNVPGVAIQSMIDALLVKSPSLVKPASGEPLWAAVWARMLADELPALAAALAVVWWPGGDRGREAAVLDHAEAVIANAGNEAIADLRRRLPPHVRLVDYGARVSFALLAREALSRGALPELARRLAYDISVFDQKGCVSPHLAFVEAGGECGAADLALALDAALAVVERDLPAPDGAAGSPWAAVAARRARDDLEWRELMGAPLMIYGPPDGRWTVAVDEAAAVGPGPGGRLIVLRPVAALDEAVGLLAPLREFLQSAALSAPPERRNALAGALGRIGVTRVAALGAQGWPGPLWHHDGRAPLGALIRWSDLEPDGMGYNATQQEGTSRLD